MRPESRRIASESTEAAGAEGRGLWGRYRNVEDIVCANDGRSEFSFSKGEEKKSDEEEKGPSLVPTAAADGAASVVHSGSGGRVALRWMML